MANRPLARTLDDVPAFYDCVTPQWLTAVVRRQHPEATVVGYTLGEVDSGTTNRRRIFLAYALADQGRGYPTSFFCKAAQDLANRITMSVGSAVGEARFYNEVRGDLAIEAPRAIFAAVDPISFRAIIVLNDLASEAEFCTYRTQISKENARSQVELLAKMHGRFYESPELTGRLASFDPFPARFMRFATHHGMEQACDNGFMAASSVIPASVIARRAEVWPLTLRSLDLLATSPQTLQHGDVHLGNWYVRHNGQMGLSDFQNVTRGHWSRDLAYALSTSLTVDDRRRCERELIRHYLDTLATHSGVRGIARIVRRCVECLPATDDDGSGLLDGDADAVAFDVAKHAIKRNGTLLPGQDWASDGGSKVAGQF